MSSIRRRAPIMRRSLGILSTIFLAAVAIASFAARATAGDQDGLAWMPFTAHSYDAARASGEPFVIEFGADWCKPCKEMEERTFTDRAVVDAANGMTFLSVDMTTSDQMTQLILDSFEVVGAPTTLFFEGGGKEWKRKVGFIGPAEFAEILERLWVHAEPADSMPEGGAQGA